MIDDLNDEEVTNVLKRAESFISESELHRIYPLYRFQLPHDLIDNDSLIPDESKALADELATKVEAAKDIAVRYRVARAKESYEPSEEQSEGRGAMAMVRLADALRAADVPFGAINYVRAHFDLVLDDAEQVGALARALETAPSEQPQARVDPEDYKRAERWIGDKITRYYDHGCDDEDDKDVAALRRVFDALKIAPEQPPARVDPEDVEYLRDWQEERVKDANSGRLNAIDRHQAQLQADILGRALAVLEPAPSETRDDLAAQADLRAAFDAGFEASSEGYNGEYLHSRHSYPECNDDKFADFLARATQEPEGNR
jgi:hypothetical protein